MKKLKNFFSCFGPQKVPVVSAEEEGRHGESTSKDNAQKIMGKNFFGDYEATIHFGVSPSEYQLDHLAEVPFGKGVLDSCKDTHILVAVFSPSVVEILEKVEPSHSFENMFYKRLQFANYRGNVSWHLVRKNPFIGVKYKDWDEEQQESFLGKKGNPSARVMVHAIIGHFLSTGERPFEGVYARCSDEGPCDTRINVGDLGVGCFGLKIGHSR